MKATEEKIPKDVHMDSEGEVVDKKEIVVPTAEEIISCIVQLAEGIKLRKEEEAEIKRTLEIK